MASTHGEPEVPYDVRTGNQLVLPKLRHIRNIDSSNTCRLHTCFENMLGSFLGFEAILTRFIEEELTIIALANLADVDLTRVTELIAKLRRQER